MRRASEALTDAVIRGILDMVVVWKQEEVDGKGRAAPVSSKFRCSHSRINAISFEDIMGSEM